ncbi:MAG: hypothetical protein WCI45_03085 [Desulfuromonadales bacterium]
MPTTPSETAQELRQRAEELFRTNDSLITEMPSPKKNKQIIHELQVLQIELEMQNNELRRTQIELEAGRSRYFDRKVSDDD